MKTKFVKMVKCPVQ